MLVTPSKIAEFSVNQAYTFCPFFTFFYSPLASLIKPARFRKKGDPDLRGECLVYGRRDDLAWGAGRSGLFANGTISKAVNITHPGSTLSVDLTAWSENNGGAWD